MDTRRIPMHVVLLVVIPFVISHKLNGTTDGHLHGNWRQAPPDMATCINTCSDCGYPTPEILKCGLRRSARAQLFFTPSCRCSGENPGVNIKLHLSSKGLSNCSFTGVADDCYGLHVPVMVTFPRDICQELLTYVASYRDIRALVYIDVNDKADDNDDDDGDDDDDDEDDDKEDDAKNDDKLQQLNGYLPLVCSEVLAVPPKEPTMFARNVGLGVGFGVLALVITSVLLAVVCKRRKRLNEKQLHSAISKHSPGTIPIGIMVTDKTLSTSNSVSGPTTDKRLILNKPNTVNVDIAHSMGDVIGDRMDMDRNNGYETVDDKCTLQSLDDVNVVVLVDDEIYSTVKDPDMGTSDTVLVDNKNYNQFDECGRNTSNQTDVVFSPNPTDTDNSAPSVQNENCTHSAPHKPDTDTVLVDNDNYNPLSDPDKPTDENSHGGQINYTEIDVS